MAAFDAGTSAAKRRRETTPFVVATRTDVDRRGAGYGVPPLVPKGGHKERRPKGPEDSHQHQGGTCRVLRTLLGRWQAHLGVSGQRYCWSPGRKGRCSGTQASGTSWSRLSMLLCCRWWNSCRMFTISSPRVCRLLPSRLSSCPRSSSRTSSCDACVVSRSWRNSWWKCRRS